MKNLFDSLIEYDRVLAMDNLAMPARKVYEYFRSNALLIIALSMNRSRKEIERQYKETANKWQEANRALGSCRVLTIKVKNR